jgi:hypothetical protein
MLRLSARSPLSTSSPSGEVVGLAQAARIRAVASKNTATFVTFFILITSLKLIFLDARQVSITRIISSLFRFGKPAHFTVIR